MGKSETKILLVTVLFMAIMELYSCSKHSNRSSLVKSGTCRPSERKALLNFKNSVNTTSSDDPDVWSSWEGEDCCSWPRVICHPATGHVVELHLQGYHATGHLAALRVLGYKEFSYLIPKYLFEAEKMETCLQHLLELNYLEHLDLSFNDFNYSKIPKLMGSMKQLRYLNLSYSVLSGVVPHELGNLTYLHVLDLAYTSRQYHTDGIIVDNLKWVSSLRELLYLDLSTANLSQAHDWMELLILSSLTDLHLSWCSLMTSTYPTHLSLKNSSLSNLPMRQLDLNGNDMMGELPPFIQNMTSLEHLDLSENNFGNQIPLWLSKLTRLTRLHFKESGFTGIEGGGNVMDLIQSLCSLKLLDLRYNRLHYNLSGPRVNSSTTNSTHFALESLYLSGNDFISGHIPTWFGEKFQSLKSLDLSYNNISGQVPSSLGKLSAMESLDISSNPLEATVLSESHFHNLSSLTTLHMSYTFLTLKLPSNWVPPFQLEELEADSCKINGPFPSWIKTQKKLSDLSLENASIYGVLPKWFHKMQSLSFVDLSYNQISGCPIFPIHFQHISLSNNSISCQLLANDSNKNYIYNQANSLDLSNNRLFGNLRPLYQRMPNLTDICLSNNQIDGSIPESMCHFTSLQVLQLHKNKLSGTIPICLGHSSNLQIVRLSSNQLSGNVPCFSGNVNNSRLSYLQLNDNLLSGEVPSCLANLSSLSLIDVGDNQLSGEFPMWITSKNTPGLQILRLRNNKIKGNIPKKLCSLTSLQLLDLGHNSLTGIIPGCLSNLSTMIETRTYFTDPIFQDKDGIEEVIKGIEREYTTTLDYMISIDLSCNKLVGVIPDSITILQGLLSLNLSYNQLTGSIPPTIGDLKSLESLDFSRNKLHGLIPTSMADLNNLAYLDFSYNNLSGPIPTSRQLQTLNNDSYGGNPYLCGEPLTKKCKSNTESFHNQDEGDDEDKRELMWFYLVVMSGVATGFWGVVGTLLLKKNWRHALFRQVENAQDWLYVAIVVRMAKLKNRRDGSSN